MSTGNGDDRTTRERFVELQDRLIGVIPQNQPQESRIGDTIRRPMPGTAELSSRERSQLSDAMIAAIEAQGRQITALTASLDALSRVGIRAEWNASRDALEAPALVAIHAKADSIHQVVLSLERQHASCERRIDKNEQAIAAKLNTFASRLRLLLMGR